MNFSPSGPKLHLPGPLGRLWTTCRQIGKQQTQLYPDFSDDSPGTTRFPGKTGDGAAVFDCDTIKWQN